jgi:hypothetical protein
MERTVKVYAVVGGIQIRDSEYCWDISEILSDDSRRRAEEIASENKPDQPYDVYLCGEMNVQVDEVEFLTYVLNREIQSKAEVQKELGRVIVGLEKKTLGMVTDAELLGEAKRRRLIN